MTATATAATAAVATAATALALDSGISLYCSVKLAAAVTSVFHCIVAQSLQQQQQQQQHRYFTVLQLAVQSLLLLR